VILRLILVDKFVEERKELIVPITALMFATLENAGPVITKEQLSLANVGNHKEL
jgi:hypothetical protein